MEPTYRITITRLEVRPEANDENLSRDRRNARMMGIEDDRRMYPPMVAEIGVLSTEISAEQFKTVQREVLKAFE